MKRNLIAAVLASAALALGPATVQAQGQAVPRGGGDSGNAGPRAGGGGGSPSGGGATQGGSQSGGDRSGGASSRGGDSGSSSPRSGDRAVDRGSRNPGEQPRTAVPRDRNSRPGGPTTIVVRPGYPGGYYPWGWGGLGFGGWYGGYYDPWWFDGYPYAYYYGEDRYEGALRLKVKPRSASVYVDGYYAGEVDDYDGVFQRLHIDPGPHRIEIRQEGFESLFFDVRIQPNRTVTYSGELQPLP